MKWASGMIAARYPQQMATRLLSFLTDIEKALIKESVANMGPTWDAARMVSYHHGMARLLLSPPKDAEAPAPGGSIFLQSFLLADGSPCLKTTLGWDGSTATSVISVYSKPAVDWKSEASHIASAWLAGPPAVVAAAPEAASEPGLVPLASATG
jgi:hypothetical protein